MKPLSIAFQNTVQFSTKNANIPIRRIFWSSPTRMFSPFNAHQIPASVNSIPAIKKNRRDAAGSRWPLPAENTATKALRRLVSIPTSAFMMVLLNLRLYG